MALTLQQLRYVVAVADTSSFSRAAEQCFVSQPALSTQVRKAERALGVELFERSTHGVFITPVGAGVVTKARVVLDGVDDLVDAANTDASRDPFGGRLRLGVIPTIAPYFLPGALSAIRDAHPALQVYLREERTDEMVGHLLHGDLDLLLLALPVNAAGVTEYPLFDDPFFLAVSDDHPLAKSRTFPPGQLAGEQLVLLEEGHCLRDQALDVCRLAGAHEGRAEIQGTSLGTVVEMVANGLGVTLLPAMALDSEVRLDRPVRVLPFRGKPPVRHIGLAWRASVPAATDRAYRSIAELLHSVAPTPPTTGTGRATPARRNGRGTKRTAT